MVRSYSTNNSDAVAVEGESSNEVMFVIPDPVVVHAVVGIPLVTPITQLSSNPVARITVFLEESTNLKTWEQASPVFQYDVGGRSNGFLRTRLGVSPIP